MSGRTVLVTGASRGIGKAIALRFAREHDHVAISCLKNEAKLMETKAEIEALQHARPEEAGCRAAPSDLTDVRTPSDASGSCGEAAGCLAYVGDMGDMDCCREFVSLAEQRFGRIDILVNNAGISYIGLLQDMSCEEWDRIIRTDLTSAFYLSKLVIPGMVRRQAGHIINISSVWGSAGASCETAYSAAKGALNAFTRALAKELAPSHVRVNAVACGAIDTEMNHFLTPEELAALTDQIPAGRLGTPGEAADLVWQLTQSNAYLTGQVIGLDGGWI